VQCWELVADKLRMSQLLIVTGERSGLRMHIAVTERDLSLVAMKS
jgi:hypothetical protein